MTPYPAMVDARSGIVQRIEPHPVHEHLPRSLKLFASVIADTTCFGPWRADSSGMGCSFWDEDAAIGAAIGEAAERYCGNLVPSGLTVASYDELGARGCRAVDPRDLALYSFEQYSARGFPFAPLTPDLEVRWVRGRNVLDREPIWVPASLVWTTYFEGEPTRAEPRTNGTLYAGIAAGPDRASAEWSALCELVERDAMTLCWTGGGSGCRLQAPSWLARLARGPHGCLDTRFFRFPNDVGLEVVGALVVDEVLGYLSLGTACRPEALDAAVKALAEAAHVQMVMHELDDPNSAMAKLGDRPGSPLKPWRGERDYRHAYRADWRDATDPGCHMQAFLDPVLVAQLVAEVESWPAGSHISGGQITGRQTTHPVDPARLVAETARALARLGVEVVSVDVTTDDVRSAGLCVVRLLAPGLYSNAPAAFPFLGGARLRQAQHDSGRPLRLGPLPH